ncbi:MAG TPA: fumarylacetoacetate hydrolase family protein [Devosia sp.]|nr:fumarylacetoacetate hydrolase family protein [Devosia sp.]
MTSEAELIRLLTEAQRSGSRALDATTLGDLDRAAAYRVLSETKMALGEASGMLKTAIHPDGVGVAAPIFASRVGRSERYSLPADRVIGLEVEVGLVLAHTVPNDPQIDEATVVQSIDHYFVGVEVIGTRYADRSKASPAGGLADNMSAFGYVIGPRFGGTDPNGLPIVLEHAGKEVYSAPAKHGFGTVLASLVAYARAQQPTMPLTAGTAVTTGSLCGLVFTSGPGHVIGRLGDDAVELELV